MVECITGCHHDTQCMRQCWIDHDRCAINCPCNEECPDGCPTPFIGHKCDTWFCQGQIEVCASETDWNRIKCPHGDQISCEKNGCCWVPYIGKTTRDEGVPWCHEKKLQDIKP